jgi:hypothetical protein
VPLALLGVFLRSFWATIIPSVTKIFQLLAEEQVRFRSDFERPAHHASQL